MATIHGTAKKKVNMRFRDEDKEVEPRKKEIFKREPHKTMRYAQI